MAKTKVDKFQTFTERFGQRVAHFRKRRGWTQAELAERLDIATTHVASVEIGIKRPSFDLVHRLAQILGVPARELFNFDESKAWLGAEWEGNASKLREEVADLQAEDVAILNDVARRFRHRS